MDHIGIDLGGTKIEGVRLDGRFRVLDRQRVPTPGSYRGILESILDMAGRLGGGDHTVGVCTPGTTSGDAGVITNSNTRCLAGMPFKGDLEELLGRRIAIENDANCFALAEARMGAAAGHGMVFGVIMGTGVGGGIIIDGEIRRGRTGIAGEWGHHTLHRGGNECYCGRRGCVETYISGPALEKRWRELVGGGGSLREIAGRPGAKGADLWKAEFLENFGSALANVIDILDPDAVVLGGGVSNIGFLYDEGRDHVHERVFSDSADTPILKNRLGDSAGVFGACLLPQG